LLIFAREGGNANASALHWAAWMRACAGR